MASITDPTEEAQFFAIDDLDVFLRHTKMSFTSGELLYPPKVASVFSLCPIPFPTRYCLKGCDTMLR